MERYEQERRLNFRKDDAFAATTLRGPQQRQTKASHSEVARHSRLEELPRTSGTRKRVKDTRGSESEDELLLTPQPNSSQPPAKEFAESTRSRSQKQGESTSQRSSQKSNQNTSSAKPKRTIAKLPVDLSPPKPKASSEAAKYLASFLADDKEKTSTSSGASQRNKEKRTNLPTKHLTTTTRPIIGSKRTVRALKIDILNEEDPPSSDSEAKVRSKRNKLPSKPKPFPMDISSLSPTSSGTFKTDLPLPSQKRMSSSVSSTSPNAASHEQLSAKSVQNDDDMDYSSDSLVII